jgi:hypothetical protein
MVHLNFHPRASMEPSVSTCKGKPSSGVDQQLRTVPADQYRSTNLAKAALTKIHNISEVLCEL